MIRARDRAGLLAKITAVISGAGSNMHSLESRPDRSNARIDASLEIADRRQLETIVANIRKVSGVYGVERVFQVGPPFLALLSTSTFACSCIAAHLSFRTSTSTAHANRVPRPAR